MIGYDANKYNEMMHSIGGNFDMICENIMQMQDYVEKSGSDCVVATYHLITDTDNQEEELEKYKELVKRLGVKSEIWRMHNWSGVYDNKDKRNGTVKTCELGIWCDVVIRAGGLDGQRGAVRVLSSSWQRRGSFRSHK